MEQVSFFRPPLSNTIPEPAPMTLREVWEYIRGDSVKYLTDRLRETGDTSIKKYKLPFVTFGGVFDYRITDAQKDREDNLKQLERETNPSEIERLERIIKLQEGKRGLVSPSGYLILDIDHVSKIGRDIRELRDELLQDKELGLRLIFISPRGDGLKLVIQSALEINTPEDFKSDTFSVLGYIHETHNIPYFVREPGEKPEKILDRDCTDIPRSCLLCHDPESVLVEEGSPLYSFGFDPEEHKFPEQEVRDDMDKEEGKERQAPRPTIPQGINSFDWTDFVDRKLVPAMFGRIDEIFPDMNFRYRRNSWESPLKLDGTPAKSPRREKSVITSKRPERILEHGGDSIGVIDFYMQKTGLSFSEARIELSRICGLEEEELELRRKHAEDLNKDRRTTNTMTNKETPAGEEKVPQKGKFDDYFDLPRKGELWEDLARDPEGFKTSFYFGEEELVIPKEGVTYICGLSSHFKSTLLRNLALQMTEDESQGEGDVIFFSLEESTRKAKLRLLCSYSDTYFPKVRDYAKTRDLDKVSINPEYRNQFTEKSDIFESFLTSGKLRIYTSPDNVFDLVELLEEYGKRRPIKAVFIDFIQRLKAGKVSSRTDEMRIIAETLQNYTKRNTIPVIVAAQLNRLTPSPARMGANNIAESADLTRYAETIICLWGSQKREDVTDINFFGSDEDSRLRKLGFVLGNPGTIYAKITKNKEGESGIEGVLKVNGGTGLISQEEKGDIGGVRTDSRGRQYEDF